MPSAFNEKERKIIKKSLLDAATEFASTIGMKNTTIDQLADRAEISKGAFYKFYDSKEDLFFEVIEEYHTEMYDAAYDILVTRTDLPMPKRTAKALLCVFETMDKKSLIKFVENDMPAILRKIPQEKIQAHYHSDEVHLKDIIERAGIELSVSTEVATSVLKGIFFAVFHRKEIGENFNTALSILIEGACDRIVKP